MAINFNSDPVNIYKLFKNSIFCIPNYQRPYRWEDEQVLALWNDLKDSYDNKIIPYFLGSVVLVKERLDEERGDVIDGQQRITTLMILFHLINIMFPNINKNTKNEDKNIIKNGKIKECIFYDIEEDDSYRLRLVSDKSNRVIFHNMIKQNEERYFEKLEKPSKEELKSDDPKPNYINTAILFYERLKALRDDEKISDIYINDFVNYVFFDVIMIEITCDKLSFAMKLFNVINDRGLDLMHSDIFKSFLLEKMTSKSENETREDHKRNEDEGKKNENDKEDEKNKSEDGKNKDDIESFEASWKECSDVANDNKIRMDELLLYYRYYLLEDTPKKALSDELEEFFANELKRYEKDKNQYKQDKTNNQLEKEFDESTYKFKSVNDIISDIVNFCTTYDDVNSSKSIDIVALKYLPWDKYWVGILVAVQEYEESDRIKIYETLRKFLYLSYITGQTLNSIKQTLTKIIKLVKGKSDVKKIEDAIEEKIHPKDKNGDIIDGDDLENMALENLFKNAYQEDWLKPVLLAINCLEFDDGNAEYIENSIQIHAEHILPQDDKQWATWNFNDEEAKRLLNKLGNMAILNYSKNIRAKNYSFAEKVNIYKGKDRKGKEELFGKTKFETTVNIINDYDNKKYNQEWNKLAIRDRQDYLIGKIEDKLLKLKFDEKKKKGLMDNLFPEFIETKDNN